MGWQRMGRGCTNNTGAAAEGKEAGEAAASAANMAAAALPILFQGHLEDTDVPHQQTDWRCACYFPSFLILPSSTHRTYCPASFMHPYLQTILGPHREVLTTMTPKQMDGSLQRLPYGDRLQPPRHTSPFCRSGLSLQTFQINRPLEKVADWRCGPTYTHDKSQADQYLEPFRLPITLKLLQRQTRGGRRARSRAMTGVQH